jgi:hypothetical protein
VAGAVYVLAAAFLMLNEHFDGSPPEILRTTVVAQSTRYSPFPIHVVECRDAAGKVYRVQVLAEVAARLDAGSQLSVVKKRGLFGKTWLQDQEFYESLERSRIVQGGLFVALAGLMVFLWLRESRRLRAVPAGIATLGLAFLVAFAIFRLWL